MKNANLKMLYIVWFNSDILEKQNYADSKKSVVAQGQG